MKTLVLLAALALATAASPPPATSPTNAPSLTPTLDRTRAAGHLSCGVTVPVDDFAKDTTHGNLSGLGAAICQAVAAAALGSPDHAQVRGYPDDREALQALHAGAIDLLVGSTPDTARALAWKVTFAPPVFMDGVGFLVPTAAHVTEPRQLAGKTVCYLSETAADDALHSWLARAGITILDHPFEEVGEMEAALITHNCDAIADDVSSLAAMRPLFHGRVHDFVILDQTISLEPFAPAVRSGDPRWAALVTDVVDALVQADELGVTKANLGATQADPAAARLLGHTPGLVTLLGLPDGWAKRAIAVGGNYGEIFDRTVGAVSPLHLSRGPNAPWNKGGMLVGTPF